MIGIYSEGHNPDLKYLAHLREPLRALPKPLVWYLVAEGLAGVKHAVLAAAGFKWGRRDGFLYYTLRLPSAAEAAVAAAAAAAAGSPSPQQQEQQQQRRHGGASADDESSAPIFFAHGVGLGLLPYLFFVLKLAALGRPLIAIEYPHLAMRWTRFIPTVDQVRAAVFFKRRCGLRTAVKDSCGFSTREWRHRGHFSRLNAPQPILYTSRPP